MAATSVKKVENKTARRGFLKWAKAGRAADTDYTGIYHNSACAAGIYLCAIIGEIAKLLYKMKYLHAGR